MEEAYTLIDGTPARDVGPHGLYNDTTYICYEMENLTPDSLKWMGDNPIDAVFSRFCIQVIFIVFFTRTLAYLIKPLRQPKIVAEILGGLLLGPSLLGNVEWFSDFFFPYNSLSTLETMSDLGLLLFMFLVGVEMDLTLLKRMRSKAIVFALAGMTVPFCIGVVFGSFRTMRHHESALAFVLFFGIAVSVTAFPVLARILAELKLLNTELGQMALSSALLSDVFGWIALLVAMVAARDQYHPVSGIGTIVNYVIFLGISYCVFQPSLNWISRRTPEGKASEEADVCLTILGCLVYSFVVNAIGIPSLFGAFMYGLLVPVDPLGSAIVEHLEDFVYGLLLPLFFSVTGLHTDVFNLDSDPWHPIVIAIVLAGVAKVGVTILIANHYKMPTQEGVALGVLMNAKGLAEIVIIKIGKDQGVFKNEVFSTMVVVSVVSTCFVTPVLTIFYRPARQTLPYRKRNVQCLKLNNELPVLACLHGPRNVTTIINLLEAAQPTMQSPVYLYALHLLELTDRDSSIVIVRNVRKSDGGAANRIQSQHDYIINTFQEYKQRGGTLSVEPLCAVSPYSTMHEDICNTAVGKRAALIILPFHKQQTIDGEMEIIHPAYQTINKNVLAKSPCSVGILVDRKLESARGAGDGQISQRIVVFFLGGPDDREALAYAARMVQNPAISLTVVRFLPGEEITESATVGCLRDERGIIVPNDDDDGESKADDAFINTFLTKNMNKNHVSFIEKIVNNGAETIHVIRSMDGTYDLYIVGKGQGDSPLTEGLTEWSECPELGIIGDLLASHDFVKTTSVLVMQKYHTR